MKSLLCFTLAIALMAGVIKADLNIIPGDEAELSDREIIEALVKSVARQEKRIETLEATVLSQNDVIAAMQKDREDRVANRDSDPGARVKKLTGEEAMVDEASRQELGKESEFIYVLDMLRL